MFYQSKSFSPKIFLKMSFSVEHRKFSRWIIPIYFCSFISKYLKNSFMSKNIKISREGMSQNWVWIIESLINKIHFFWKLDLHSEILEIWYTIGLGRKFIEHRLKNLYSGSGFREIQKIAGRLQMKIFWTKFRKLSESSKIYSNIKKQRVLGDQPIFISFNIFFLWYLSFLNISLRTYFSMPRRLPFQGFFAGFLSPKIGIQDKKKLDCQWQ